MKISKGKSSRKKILNEYDLAYICYYSEKIELSSIGVGFSPNLPAKYLENLIQELKREKKFIYYKNMYKNLFEETY